MDFSYNRITKAGLKIFKEKIKFLPSLKTLNLSSIIIIILLIDNPILDNGFYQLCECFIDLKLLNYLDLSKCVIKTIDERISMLKQLKELHLENNLLTNESKTAVSELFSDITDLKLYF